MPEDIKLELTFEEVDALFTVIYPSLDDYEWSDHYGNLSSAMEKVRVALADASRKRGLL